MGVAFVGRAVLCRADLLSARTHSATIGDAELGVETESSEKQGAKLAGRMRSALRPLSIGHLGG